MSNPIKYIYSKTSLLLCILLLSACSFGGEKVSLLHLKMGSNILEFDQMQAKDWSVPPEELAYIGQINVRSPVKIELGRNISLDIPNARTMLIIENSRFHIMNLFTIPEENPKNAQSIKSLYERLFNTLKQHPDWEFNVKLDRWMRVSDVIERSESEESLWLDLGKGSVHLTYNSDTKLSGCLSPLHDYRDLFEKEKIKKEPDLDIRLESLSGIDIDAVKTALEIFGRENPRDISLKKYVSNVNSFMERKCPDMLSQYGR